MPTSDSAKSMAWVILKIIDPELFDAEVLEIHYMTSARDDASADSGLKLGSILVTLCNSKVAKRLIAAKIIKKKLTTDQLSAELVEAANLTLPSSPSAMNIDEYMSKELYDLRRQVYKASKVKKNNFITFMREECIYVRFKNEKTSSPIYSAVDLEAFLGQPAEE